MVHDFLFDGQRLSGFGYMLCKIDGSLEEDLEVSVMEYTDVKTPKTDTSHKVATAYPNNYTRTIQISKSICGGDDNDYLTNDDISELTKWLCRKEYKWFKWIDDEDDDDIYYEVRCTVTKIMTHGNCIALSVTLNTNRPYGLTREVTYQKTLSANGSFNLTCFSDEEGYIYPNVKIRLNQSGNLQMKIMPENSTTRINGCTSGETITLDGVALQATTTNPNHSLAINYNYRFPRIYNEYKNNVNTISSNLACTITLTYRGIRKVGL